MFLYKNHEKANLIREEIELTKAHIKSLSEELKNYQSYGNTSKITLDT